MTCCAKCMPQTFCFCSTLDRGALIIGITGLVLSILSFVRSVATSDQSANVYYGSIIGSILLIIASIFLIIAVKKNRPAFCWPYMILASIAVITMIINLVGSILAGDGITGVISVIVVGLEIYFLLVVISYYKNSGNSVPVSNA